MRSVRRGTGADVAGSRPYRPGDDMDAIDWNASARLSAARDADEFIVRERFADEAPRTVVVCDRRPEMSLFPDWLPWLSKPQAVRTATLMIADSTTAVRGLGGYLDLAEGETFWRPPRSQHEEWRLERQRPFRAPQDNLDRAFQHLFTLRPSLPTGSFVFVLSDFIVMPSEDIWLQAPERREANETRWQQVLDTFHFLDMTPVILSSARPDTILEAFIWWSEKRLHWRPTL